jgi:serpin B
MKNSNDVCLKINEWVSKITEGKIKNLIPAGVLTSMTKLVLVNAIYFKGSWEHKFKESKTQKLPFYNENGNSSKVELMYQKSKLKFFKSAEYKLLQLPYKNNDLSMNIVLPNKDINIKELEDKLKLNQLFTIINNSRRKKVRVYIPKFKFDLALGLNSIMKKLGMKDAFTNSANFSKMTDKNDIKISRIIHKAFIDVNEEGTEAAAATAVIMVGKSMSRHFVPDPIFKADHPFIFFIVDNKHKEILFIGRILNL